ncbi:hypothetical protein PG984_007752 [Apiospora sp. TS-2023a]
MSLLTRSLLKTENRLVNIPAETRAIWTGISTLQEMLGLFGVICTKAPDFVKDSASGFVTFKLPKATLDDPFINGLLQPGIHALNPDPSADPTLTAAQLLDQIDDRWLVPVLAAKASRPV